MGAASRGRVADYLLLAAGPGDGPERFAAHTARLGPRPDGDPTLTGALREAGLCGCGGARFPAWRKWDAVASGRPGAVIVVNGAEGEPASSKDRMLLRRRPHLVLDGALLAAESLGAMRVHLYINESWTEVFDILEQALSERPEHHPRIDLVGAPDRWIAGEETAAVNYLNGGAARPAFVPPRPFERGVGGRPTLVHNVETLAHVAMIARRAAAGSSTEPPLLLTVGGSVRQPGVYEVNQGTTIADVLALSGGDPRTVLLGGYFGSWILASRFASMRLQMGNPDVRLGCGVLFAPPREACPIVETAHVLSFLAAENAGQCGPCRVGLPALAELAGHVARGTGGPDGRERLVRWAQQLAHNRGACRHPDGAAGLLLDAASTFPQEFSRHAAGQPCHAAGMRAHLPLPLQSLAR